MTEVIDNITKVLLVFSFCVNLLLTFLVFSRGAKKKSNIFFGFLLLCLTFWNSTHLFVDILALRTNEASALFWSKMSLLGPILIPVFLLLFALFFAEDIRKIKGRYIFLIILPAIFLMVFIPTSFNIKRIILKPWGVEFIPGPLYFYFITFFITYIVWAILILYRKKKNSKNKIEQFHLKVIIYSTVLAGFLGIVSNSILPLLWHNTKFHFYGVPLTGVFSLAVTYVILRHRFLDIKLVLKKSLIYFLSFVLTLGLYTYLAFLLKNFFQERLALSESASLFVLILIIAVGFPLVKQVVDQGLKKYVFQKRKDPVEILRKIKERADPSLDLEVALQKAVHCLREGLPQADMRFFCAGYKENILHQHWPKAEESLGGKDDIICYLADHPGEILVKEELSYLVEEASSAKAKMLTEIVKRMEEMKASVVVPLAASDPYQLIGLLILGPKKQGQLYTVQDIEFLKEFADCFMPILFNIFMYWRAVERAVGMRT